jgi:protein tyrosine phosphatase domain-containing protein 1
MGEHPHCGDGNIKNIGFSYEDDLLHQRSCILTADQIGTYHFHWEDLKTTSPEILLKNVRIMNGEIERGRKILVHCHAGRGRTGMVICSLLIFRYRMTSNEAIALFRSKREGVALDSKDQQGDIKIFEKCSVVVTRSTDFGSDLLSQRTDP